VKASPSGAVAGQDVIVSARIANDGTGTAVPFTVQSYVDGIAGRAITVPGLAPGSAVTVTFPAWTASAGGHRLRVAADPAARIAEPVETNNTLEQPIAVGGR
jgi:subtilase family serine protease